MNLKSMELIGNNEFLLCWLVELWWIITNFEKRNEKKKKSCDDVLELKTKFEFEKKKIKIKTYNQVRTVPSPPELANSACLSHHCTS